jgi:hypothetical protein
MYGLLLKYHVNVILHVQKDFEQLRIAKTKEYFRNHCVPVSSMVRPPPVPKILLSSGSHVNVGEWVDDEHCYSVGTCNDGGIAIVTKFVDEKADVRYHLNFALSLKRYRNSY